MPNATGRTPLRALIALAMALALTAPAAAAQGLAARWSNLGPTDPLHTQPPQLSERLHLSVPPDLLVPSSQNPGTNAGPADESGLAPLELDCGTRAAAADPGNEQWALHTLRAGSPGAAVPTLSLPMAIELVVCHNPQVRASWSQIAQQAAGLGQAKSAWWPQLNAGIGRERSSVGYGSSYYPGTLTQASAQNVQLNWRLWDFGARSARVAAAQAQLQAALSGQDAALQKAIVDVLQAYTAAQAAQARLVTQGQLLPLAARNLLAARRRQAGGAGSAGDTLQARTVQARIALEQSRAEGELHKAQAQLVYQTGLPPGTSFALSALLPETTAEVTGDLTARPAEDNPAQDHPLQEPPRATALPTPQAAPLQASAAVPRTGRWRIQLGLFSQPAQARAAWDKFRARPASHGLEAALTQAGPFTRLIAGPLASPEAAAAACDALKASDNATCTVIEPDEALPVAPAPVSAAPQAQPVIPAPPARAALQPALAKALPGPDPSKTAPDNPAGPAGLLSGATQQILARTLDGWLDYARAHHPAIEAARANLKAAQASLKAVQAETLPTLELALGYYRNGRPTETLSTVRSTEKAVNLTLNIPLFNGFGDTYKIRNAQALVEQKQIELQAAEQQTLQALVQQHAAAHASLNNLRAAADLYRAAHAAVQSAQRQYEHGAMDIVQLNQSLTALQQAQDDLVSTQLQWSQARLALWMALWPGKTPSP